MSKFKAGGMVVPHEFDGPPGWDDIMSEFLERPGKIIDTWKVDGVTDRFYHINTNKWVWPERALTPLSSENPAPSYDLKEFTLAAMTKLMPKWNELKFIDGQPYLPVIREMFRDVANLSIIMAKAQIDALEKEVKS